VCVVLDSCTELYVHMCKQFLKLSAGSGLGLVFVWI